MPSIAIPKKNKLILSEKLVKKNKGLVILSIDEYKDLCERAVPVYYLKGKSAKEVDNLVKEGIEEYKNGKTKKIDSLSQLK